MPWRYCANVMDETPDIQKLLAQHINARQERDRAAYRARDLLEAGDAEGAREALAEAYEWEARMSAIEDATEPKPR